MSRGLRNGCGMMRSAFATMFVLSLILSATPALANEATTDPIDEAAVEDVVSEDAEVAEVSEVVSDEAVADTAEGQADTSSHESDGPVLATASTTSKTYKITYKLKGGKNNTANPSTYATNSKTIKFANPTRKGYKFAGWYSDEGLKHRVKSLKKGSKGNKTLYAKWKMRSYKITYRLNGGKNNKGNPTKYTVKTKTIKLKKPKRSGYTFGGWYRDAALTKRVKSIKKGSTGNKKLYAKWVGEDYVDIDDDGGSGGNNPTSSTEPRGHVTCTSSYCTDYGAVAIYRNDSSRSVSITVKFIYYIGSTPVETSIDNNYCLEPNRSCALRGWVMGTEDYTSYSMAVSCEWASDSKIGNANSVSYSSNFGNKNVIVSVTNNGVQTEFTKVAIVFYKNGKIVGYDSHYADIQNPGSSDYLEFSFPYRSKAYNYEDITPDSYKVFINESYRYS